MTAPRLRRFARFDALVVTSLVWFLGKFLRYAFPPLFGTLGDTYGVSRAALGAAFTGFMLVYAALQFPSGLLADRVGPVRVIVGGVLLTSAGAFALVVDSPFVVLVAAMVLMGGGTGTFKTVAVRLLSRAYPARTGRALGVFDTIGTFGGVAAPAAVVLVTASVGVFGAPWRTLFLVAGVAGVGLAVAFAVRVPRRLPDATSVDAGGDADSGDETGDGARSESDGQTRASEDDHAPAEDGDRALAEDSDRALAEDGDRALAEDSDRALADGDDHALAGGNPASLRTYVGIFREPSFAAFVAVTVLFGFAYNGTVAFLPLYLAEETVLTEATANLLYSALFVVSLVQLVTGEASDRFGTAPVVALTVGVATTGLVAVVALSDAGGPFVLGAAVLVLGVGAHGFRPVRGAYLISTVPDDVAGGSLGAVRTLLMGAGAVAPAVVGVLADAVGFQVAFGLLAVALAGATGLSVVLWVTGR